MVLAGERSAGVRIEGMRWAGTRDGGKLQRDTGHSNAPIGRHKISVVEIFFRGLLSAQMSACAGWDAGTLGFQDFSTLLHSESGSR